MKLNHLAKAIQKSNFSHLIDFHGSFHQGVFGFDQVVFLFGAIGKQLIEVLNR
ncbi:hypothetical protein [Pararhodonellum marinum]|uniref:hypothetical protein n=1 Tax=Pararhodonellum marinum TaxID=2755358 RepID=UPI0018906CD7|nr:hypothetical protein [Pararhodonellum marinum]